MQLLPLQARRPREIKLERLSKSIAYQMAGTTLSTQKILPKIAQEDPHLDKNDFRKIRKKELRQSLRNNAEEDDRILLKGFLTSRPSSDLERRLAPLPVVSEHTSTENIQGDIRMYVETHSEDLPGEIREDLIQRIVGKSSGCFLRTLLVT